MASLIHRAEMTLLGALIRDPAQLAGVPWLRAEDFATQGHQAVFAAIDEIAESLPGISGSILPQVTALLTNSTDLGDVELDVLDHYGADAGPAEVYGRMIQEAALRRELAAHAERLAESAGQQRGTDPRHAYLAELSVALRTNTRNLENAAGREPGPAPPSEDARAAREEQLLVGLIQDGELASGADTWLKPDLFTSPARRDLYEATISVTRAGEPVTELTVAWEIARRTAFDDTLNGRTTGPQPPPADDPASLLTRLASVPVQIAIAAEIGRDLLANHIRVAIGRQIAAAGNGRAAAREFAADQASSRETSRSREPSRASQPDRIRPPAPERGQDGPQLRQ